MRLNKSNVSAICLPVFKIVAIFLILFSVFSYVVSLILGPILFYGTTDGLTTAAREIRDIPLSIFMVIPIQIPFRTNMGTLFGGIWLVFVLCIIAACYSRKGFMKSVKNLLTAPILSAKTNFLILMPLVATSLLSASLLIQKFQETQGVQTGSLTFPPQTSQYVILINLALAPINEELAFRITSIGFPLGLFLLYHYRSGSGISGIGNRLKFLVTVMLSPERAKAALGYKNVTELGLVRGISILEWILILVTSVAFGLAHFLLGGGWEAGKVSTALLAGLVFGIMFVAYGAYAAILLHWFFDYYFTIVNLAESTYGGIFRAFSTLVDVTNIIGGPIVLVILLLLWAVKCADYLSKRAVGLSQHSDTI